MGSIRMEHVITYRFVSFGELCAVQYYLLIVVVRIERRIKWDGLGYRGCMYVARATSSGVLDLDGRLRVTIELKELTHLHTGVQRSLCPALLQDLCFIEQINLEFGLVTNIARAASPRGLWGFCW